MKAKKLLVGLFVMFATILTACGGNDSSSKIPSNTSTPSVSTPAPSVSTPKPSTPSVSTPAPNVSTPAPSVSTPSVSTPTPSTSTSTSTPTPADPVATKISVTGTYKVSYEIGDLLDLSGMQLKITFNDDSHETINVTAEMLGDYDMTTAGIKTISVSYEGLTTSFNIEVVAPAVEKVDPEVVFSIESGAQIKVGEVAPTVTVVTEGLEYITYFEDASNNNIGSTLPSEPGRYTLIVEVTGNEQYNDLRAWRWFDLVPNKLTPEITFSIESGTTLVLGKDAAPTASVSDGLTYTAHYESESGYNSEAFPTEAGTYSYVVEVAETEEYNSARAWRWFYLIEDKPTAEVTFSIEPNTTLVLGKDAAPTVTVTEGLEYTVQYDKDEAWYSNEFPTEPGTYAMVVTVTGNDQYNGTTKWVVFTLEEQFLVYYTNPDNWSKVYAYSWDSTGPTNGAWPGSEIKKDPTTGFYFVEGLEPGANIIFNNGSGAQTADLVIPTDGNCTTNGIDWAGYGEIPETQTITVYFAKPSGWGSTVNAYMWGAQSNGSWPGGAMKYDEASGYYYIENVVPGTNIIFNDGSNQTDDLVVPSDGNNLFTQNTKSWSSYNA